LDSTGASTGSPPASPDRRVLVVEDEDFTRAAVASVLESAGFNVKVVGAASEALRALHEFDPHALVTDLDLGAGPSGVDLACRVAQDRPWVGLVILTAHQSVELAVGAAETLPSGSVMLVKSRLDSMLDIADAIGVLHRWDYNMGPENMQAAFAYATTQKIMKKTGKRGEAVEQGLFVDDSLWVSAIRKTKEEFMRHFNRLELPFGETQTFTRNGKTVGLGGIADVLAASASEWDSEAGTMECKGGDSYLQLVSFSKEGLPHIESLMAGGNCDRPNSPHYNDQMELLAEHETKPMSLSKEEVLKTAVRTYHPQ